MINYFGMRTIKSAVHLLQKRAKEGGEEGLTEEERRLLFRMVYILNEELAHKPEVVERIGGDLVRRWMEVEGRRGGDGEGEGKGEMEASKFSLDLENFGEVLEEVFSEVMCGRRERLEDNMVKKEKLPLYLTPGVCIYLFICFVLFLFFWFLFLKNLI